MRIAYQEVLLMHQESEHLVIVANEVRAAASIASTTAFNYLEKPTSQKNKWKDCEEGVQGQLTLYALEFNISNSIAQALNRGVLGSIPESDNFLVDPSTVDEINNALKANKKNKAPGRISKEVSSLKPAAIIAYDLEKAYDLVNRDVLWEVMTAMGYPPFCLSRGIDGIEHYGKRIKVRATERAAAVYWLGQHLKNLLQQIIQPKFNATHSSHPYFTTALSTITDLLKAGIFTSSTVSNHRATYNHLIANLGQPGRTEVAKPYLDWASI
ncbi:hypothetical protein DAPPUDRAFT_266497 [Daphnia pulex]|uniref:Reverse transcriptase domain-containing protein n=1 Tax=Daphnia pulex TaxID=6669 RepID=E9HV40_DAPPU|nr:hypothetical protein DAPPUDRAFT_266497 [Daphnia pulex]|eukprot:EFX64393.1 hypothetical protein DAPPUDRAFT_266497 [Daphnia pulex]